MADAGRRAQVGPQRRLTVGPRPHQIEPPAGAEHASRTHPRRLMTLDELANVAVFMACDRASGMTGTIVNPTMGSLDD